MKNRNDQNNQQRNHANNRFNQQYDARPAVAREPSNGATDGSRNDGSQRPGDESQRPPALVVVRESFSGRLLTDAQFDEAIAITGIIGREIRRSGAFKDKLGDYAYAFARSEKFDATKAETILRDLFKERFGVTMNQMRENLAEREERLNDAERRRGHDHALAVRSLIETAYLMPFHRAYAQQAGDFAQELGITDAAAKSLMVAEFKAAEQTELYDWGKNLEERFYRPQIEAEKQKREGAQRETRQTPARRRPGPSGP